MHERIPNFWSSYEHYQKNFLTADFSPRKYFRWQNGNNSLVLMDCPDLVSLQSFMNIGQYLLDQGLSVPKIIEADTSNGFLLLEDFGDATFTKVLNTNPRREAEIYNSAVDVLLHLQEKTQNSLPFLTDYHVNFGLNKVQQFLVHYYPEVTGKSADTSSTHDFNTAWERVLAIGLNTKKTIFLRDYHVDNLMDLPKRTGCQNIGLLDFQDAIWGPIAGDLVSLLHDARRKVCNDLIEAMWRKYLEVHPKGNHQEIYVTGCILSAVRQARIIGLFTRTAKERGDKRFLNRIPHLWHQLENCCALAELKPVRQWLDDNLPKSNRVIPEL